MLVSQKGRLQHFDVKLATGLIDSIPNEDMNIRGKAEGKLTDFPEIPFDQLGDLILPPTLRQSFGLLDLKALFGY
jgi:hypothetical protein